MGGGAVWWKGVQLDARTRDMIVEAEHLAGFPVQPSQGSWSGASASAGTHSGCGAIDITNLDAAHCDALVDAMRRVGFAAWHRTPEQSDWVRHCHGIAVQPGGKHDRDCLSGSAHDQVVDYYENRNGLASGAPDDGPRQHVGVTWETYHRTTEEDDMRIIWLTPSGVGGILTGTVFCGIGGGEAAALRDAGWSEVAVSQATIDTWRASGISGL